MSPYNSPAPSVSTKLQTRNLPRNCQEVFALPNFSSCVCALTDIIAKKIITQSSPGNVELNNSDQLKLLLWEQFRRSHHQHSLEPTKVRQWGVLR